jgi:hypothetical protein
VSRGGVAAQPRFRGPCPFCGLDCALGDDGRPITNHLRGDAHRAAMAAKGLPDKADRPNLSKVEATFLRGLAAGGPIEPEGRDSKTAKALRRRGLARHIGDCLTDITEAGRAWLAEEKAS